MKKRILLTIVWAMCFMISYAYDHSETLNMYGSPGNPNIESDPYEIQSPYLDVYISVEANIDDMGQATLVDVIARGTAYDTHDNEIGSIKVSVSNEGGDWDSSTFENVESVVLYVEIYSMQPGTIAGARAGLNWI